MLLLLQNSLCEAWQVVVLCCVRACCVFGLLCGNLFWIVICCAVEFAGNETILSKIRTSDQPPTICLRLL